MAEETPRADASTRWVETARGVLRYTELAPLLAEGVLRVQQSIEAEAYAERILDEELIRALHGDFCRDLVPDWAGRWRLIEVRVGAHEPPAPHLVPMAMRDYVRDLGTRLAEPIDPDLLPEHLAFAEGRLLSIHPFQDFNGRLARLWLWELLRRLNLPPVDLAPADSAAVQTYLTALRAADRHDYRPLAHEWQMRLTQNTSWG